MENKTAFSGTPVPVEGVFAVAGRKAPDFRLVKGDLSDFSLRDCAGKRVLLNIFPSLDTEICALSVRKFNEMASGMKNTLVLCVSRDLPFAQGRFCTAEGLQNVIPLSDFRGDSTFGKDYGVLIAGGPLRGLFARAVVILDESGRIVYAQMSPEITEEPDYQRALAVLQ